MGEDSPKPPSTATGAVFLSYASEDAVAAERIAAALRAGGIELWFDKSELRGGEAWDQTIRKQIKACALFIPVISRHTHERREGYFRLEWKLAVDRSNLISATQALLIPVVIDDTREDDEEVPERMHEIHWTRLPAGETSRTFVERVQRLLSGDTSTRIRGGAASGAVPATGVRAPPSGWSRRVLPVATVAVVLGTMAYLAIERPWISKPVASAAFAPPPHSIAVLPFVNMSGDKEQEYFSDGLTEELLNSLSRVNELQVAGRTSSFYFKGKEVDLSTVAYKLNVGAVLEGSVRRSANTVRITAQLVNGTTGFHLWSQTYDRDLGDVLKLQTEIATAVASALKVALLSDSAAKIELGGTHVPAALDVYLRGLQAHVNQSGSEDELRSVADYTEAIRLDPDYALAFAGRSLSLSDYATYYATGSAVGESLARAHDDARRALSLAPDLVEAHLALASALEGSLDFTAAQQKFERALALAPSNPRVLRDYASFAGCMGKTDLALNAGRRAVALDPLNHFARYFLGVALLASRHYEEAIAAFAGAVTLDPNDTDSLGLRGSAYYMLGDFQRARASCETDIANESAQVCLAIAYHRLGRHPDAEAALAKLRAFWGDARAFHYAEIYTQWGRPTEAFQSLDTAVRLRNPWLERLKTDPLLDPLRNEPRFQAIERELKFPD